MTSRSGNLRQAPRLIHDRIWAVSLMLAYVIMLHIAYRDYLAPQFFGEGLTYRPPDTWTYGGAIAAVLGLTLAMPIPIRRVSHFILWALWLTAAAPAMLIVQYSATLDPSSAIELSVAIWFAVAAIRGGLAINPLSPLRALPIRADLFWTVVAGMTIVVYTYLLLFVGVQFKYLAFSDVTTTRETFVNTTASLPLIAYLLPSQFNVINPLLIYHGLSRHRTSVLVLGLMCQLISYLTTGQKHILLMTLLLLALHLGVDQSKRIRPHLAIAGLILVSVSAMAADAVTGGLTWTSLFVRRFLVVPGVLVDGYVAVFDQREKGHFLEVLGTGARQGAESAALLVGREFMNAPGASANVNLFGHGYYSFGYIGIFIEAAFVVLMLWIADATTHTRMPLGWACALFVGPTIALTNSSPFTTVLTHGFLTAVLISAMMGDPLTGSPSSPMPTNRPRALLRTIDGDGVAEPRSSRNGGQSRG